MTLTYERPTPLSDPPRSSSKDTNATLILTLIAAHRDLADILEKLLECGKGLYVLLALLLNTAGIHLPLPADEISRQNVAPVASPLGASRPLADDTLSFAVRGTAYGGENGPVVSRPDFPGNVDKIARDTVKAPPVNSGKAGTEPAASASNTGLRWLLNQICPSWFPAEAEDNAAATLKRKSERSSPAVPYSRKQTE